MNVISSMNPAPTRPATSKTYGFGGFVVLLLVVMTLGSIGAGVDGSVNELKVINCSPYLQFYNYNAQ